MCVRDKFVSNSDAVARQLCPTVPLDSSRDPRAARACSELSRIAHYPSFGFFMLIVLLFPLSSATGGGESARLEDD